MAPLAGEEAVTEPTCSTGGGLGVATDDDRDGTSRRTRAQDAVGERGELALEGGLILAPEGTHGTDRVVGATTPLGEGDADGVELLLEPADADAESHATAGEHVEGGQLLGQDHRVPLGHDQDAGRQVDGRGHPGQVRQPDQRIGDRGVVVARHLPRRVIGVGRLVAGGHDHVLDGPERLEAHLFGPSGEGGGAVRLGEGSGVGEDDAEVHGVSLVVCVVRSWRAPCAPRRRGARVPRDPASLEPGSSGRPGGRSSG